MDPATEQEARGGPQLAWLYGRQRLGTHLGLERVGDLLDRLDQPQRDMPTFHVVGTNGKGSVATLVSQALVEEGYRAALFLSPHVSDFGERMQVGGEALPGAAIEAAIGRVRDAAREMDDDPPTFFECLTAAALVAFRDASAEVAVVEAGLGGRLDATRLAEAIAVAITSIALDHQAVLGDTIRAIAREKAGAFRDGTPGVAMAEGAAMDEIRRAAEARRSPLTEASTSGARVRSMDAYGMVVEMDAWGARRTFESRLVGRHQVQNLVTATRMLEQAKRFRVLPESATRAFAAVSLPGRFEVTGEGPMVLDVAHNPSGVQQLVRTLRDVRLDAGPVVFGATAGKDAAEMIRRLVGASSALHFCPTGAAHSLNMQALAKLADRATGPACVHESWKEALAAARTDGRPVVVTGSCFLVGPVRNHILGLPADPLANGALQ